MWPNTRSAIPLGFIQLLHSRIKLPLDLRHSRRKLRTTYDLRQSNPLLDHLGLPCYPISFVGFVRGSNVTTGSQHLCADIAISQQHGTFDVIEQRKKAVR